jgi:prolyl-tRNA synthetase
MRWSTMHIPTLRHDPADAGAPSHRLLLRAGYIRQLMAGHYSLLPLAVRVRLKVIAVIREEMNRIGAQEVLMPTVHPAELWERSGRLAVMGEEMFRLKDRRGADLVLVMTAEEVITTLAAELSSYRELPQMWYQIQTKYRDEPRPKAGLMRVREFTMKDSYSFDLDAAGLDKSFDAHYQAYTRIFERLGIPAIPVDASSGAMGGSGSTEFMCPSEIGEDDIVHCRSCGYAANREKGTSRLPEISPAADAALALDAPERFDTPGVRTIEDLAQRHDAPADRQIKTLVYVLDGKLTLVLVRGDHALEEQKLIDATGAVQVRPATADEIIEALGAAPGSLGAVRADAWGGRGDNRGDAWGGGRGDNRGDAWGGGRGDNRGVTGLPVIADEQLRGRTGMVTGANVNEVHLRGVDVGRDISVGQWADLRTVMAGEACIQCGEPLEVVKGIEVGHIFKLGHKYTNALDVTVSSPEGMPVKPIMGCYGIGVERAMAAVIEVHHDAKGITWPASIAPFDVVVTVAQQNDEAVAETGEQVYRRLLDVGVDAIIDDRTARAGEKFSDAELVGIPLRVTIGKRGLASGTAEVTERATGETVAVPLDEIPEHVRKAVATAIAANR